MEPDSGSVTVATEAVGSPQSSVSREDSAGGLWTEDSDTTEEDSSPRAGSTSGSDLEDAWPDVPLPDWLTEEPPQPIGTETPNGSDGEAEVFRCRPQACAAPTWPPGGAGERSSVPGPPDREASCAETGVPSAREDQASPLDGLDSPATPLDLGLDVERGEEVSVERKEGTDFHGDVRPPERVSETGEPSSADREEVDPTGPSKSSPITDERMRGIHCKPPDFSAAREERRGPERTSSKPPQPSLTPSSSGGQVTDPSLTMESQPSQDQERDSQQPGVLTQNSQQRELLQHNLYPSRQEQEAQQVFAGSPPLATVALEPANREPGCHDTGSVVVREWTAGRREGEGEEQRTGGDQGAEAQPSVAWLHTAEGGTEERRETGAERADMETQGGRDPRHGRMEPASGEDSQSDSGVSVDLSPRSTAELTPTPPTPPEEEPSPAPPPPNETPIEREIRNAVERERSLRRSRGLCGTQEFVEIPLRRRPILSQALPSKSGKGEGTDRQFAGKKMQREISVEAQREEVLVQMGTVPGVYDKGTVRQLRERKQLFEAFQERREVPASPSKRASACTSDKDLCAPEEPDPIAQNQNRNPGLVGSREARFSDAPSVLFGPTLCEGTGARVIIFESDPVICPRVGNPNGPVRPVHSAGSQPEGRRGVVMEADGRAREEEEDEEEEGIKENPFFRLRCSMSLRPEVEQDIQEARQRERELRRLRSSLYGAGGASGAGGVRPHSRETRSPPPPQNGLPSPETPSHTASPTSSARQSLGKLDLTWPPARTSAEVAGQTEVLRGRRKIPLLHRWESGMVNGHQEDGN